MDVFALLDRLGETIRNRGRDPVRPVTELATREASPLDDVPIDSHEPTDHTWYADGRTKHLFMVNADAVEDMDAPLG